MKFLMLCTKYPVGDKDSYMTTELAGALVQQGHEVKVSVIDWDRAPGIPPQHVKTASGVEVLITSPAGALRLGRLADRLAKWTLSSHRVQQAVETQFGSAEFDAVLAFTPCVTVSRQLEWALKRFQCPSMLFVYDFFPYHHRSIGLVPGPVFKPALRAENRLIRMFDVIGCNLPTNIDYLRKNYSLRSEQQTVWTPLWTDISRPAQVGSRALRQSHGLPEDRKLVVFGGQLTEGRGIEEMLQVAARSRNEAPELGFVFVGDGRLAPLVEASAGVNDSNVFHIRRVPREDYLQLISACDLGLVATVQGVDSASFPTKILDYLRANLPVVAALEEHNDLRTLLAEWGVGRSVAVGDVDGLFSAIVAQVGERLTSETMEARTAYCLRSVFDVQLAARKVVQYLSSVASKKAVVQ